MSEDKRTCAEFVDTIDRLGTRLNTNTQYGDNELKTWLPPHLEVKEGERVLDVGCGDGTQMRLVAETVKKDHGCFGIDNDPEMIAKAKRLSEGFTPAVDFAVMDMDTIGGENSPFQDDEFDLMYSVYAFYYSKDEFKALDGMKKKLKAGGRISIIGPYKDNNIDWFNFLNQYMEMADSIMASTTTFMEGIKKYADENFSNVRTQEFVNNITLPSYEALKEYWVANIYYDPKYDEGFEEFARKHFETNDTFIYFKKAGMITMEGKK
jgi:ubiquinone/menaquinone biosynthesis C-methylase UbiE